MTDGDKLERIYEGVQQDQLAECPIVKALVMQPAGYRALWQLQSDITFRNSITGPSGRF